jgi:hypothetical protein
MAAGLAAKRRESPASLTQFLPVAKHTGIAHTICTRPATAIFHIGRHASFECCSTPLGGRNDRSVKEKALAPSYAEATLLVAAALPFCVAIVLFCAVACFVRMSSGTPFHELFSLTGVLFFLGSLAIISIATRAHWRARRISSERGLLVRSVPILIALGVVLAAWMAHHSWSVLEDQLRAGAQQICGMDDECAASLVSCARRRLLNEPLETEEQRVTVLRSCAHQRTD